MQSHDPMTSQTYYDVYNYKNIYMICVQAFINQSIFSSLNIQLSSHLTFHSYQNLYHTIKRIKTITMFTNSNYINYPTKLCALLNSISARWTGCQLSKFGQFVTSDVRLSSPINVGTLGQNTLRNDVTNVNCVTEEYSDYCEMRLPFVLSQFKNLYQINNTF